MKTTSNTYLVTARHRLATRTPGRLPWRPYGVHHARRVGDPFTACGIAAVEWRMFWTMVFDGRSEHACADCAAVLRQPRMVTPA